MEELKDGESAVKCHLLDTTRLCVHELTAAGYPHKIKLVNISTHGRAHETPP